MHAPPIDSPQAVAASTLNQRARFAAAYSVLQSAIAERAFPGAGFGVFAGGRIVALDGVGRFTYDPNSPEVRPGTIYDLASVTKVVATTAAAMLLFDRGLLDLEMPLGEVLPGFVIGVPLPLNRCRVTFRTLLAHSSGLPAYARLFETSPTASALIESCLRMPLQALPGSRSEYSDLGFILLGKALEVLAQEPLDEFCRREIFLPLGMTASAYRPPPAWRTSIPPSEDDTTFRHRILQGEVHDENCCVLGGVSGHAGAFANALDLLRFAECILSGGKTPQGRSLFASSTVDLFATREVPPAESSRALGWDTPSGESSSGHFFRANSIGHLGYTGTSLWIDRNEQVAVVLLTNRTWPDRSSQAIRSVRRDFHDAVRKAVSSRGSPSETIH